MTDPDAEHDARTGRPFSEDRRPMRGDVEAGGPVWRTLCRHLVPRSAQRSAHQCRATVLGDLAGFPELEAAHRVDGPAAVVALVQARRRALATVAS